MCTRMHVRYFRGDSVKRVRALRASLLQQPEDNDQDRASLGCRRPTSPRWRQGSVEWTMSTRTSYMPWMEVGRLYEGYTFHLAAAASDTQYCRHLIEAGVRVNAPDPRGNTPLLVAAAVPGVESNKVVRTLLRCFQDPDERAKYVNMTNHDGLTALHFAVLASRPSLVQLLLDAGADPNAGTYSTLDRESFGLTPLHFTLSSMTDESARCRQLLLEAGADPNVEMACSDNSLISATLTLECGCGGCFSKDIECFRGVVTPRLGKDASKLSRMGSCVTLAARQGDYEAVNVLLQAKHPVNVDVSDSNGLTALWWAVVRLMPTLVNTLIDAGANVNHCIVRAPPLKRGGSMLHYTIHAALLKSCPDWDTSLEDRLLQTAHTLLNRPDVDVNLRDVKGRTPLMVACRFDQTMMVMDLLQRGADPDMSDRMGLTALWWACHGCCETPPRALSTILQTRVPRGLLTLPWNDRCSPLFLIYRTMDGKNISILFRAGIANHHQVTHMYQQAARKEVPLDEEAAAKLHRYRTVLKQCSSTPRMLQDICIHTVVRSLDHLTKPSERKAALESLELNPGVWKRIEGMGLAVNAKAERRFILSLPSVRSFDSP